MRHHSKHSSINRPQTRDTARTTVRIGWISLGRFEVIVHIANCNKILREQGLRRLGLRFCAFEVSAAFAVAEGDGHGGSSHLVQKDRGRLNVIEDLYFAISCFVLFADVSLEARPCFGTGDERLETSEELAAVADAVFALAWALMDRFRIAEGYHICS